MEKQGRKDSLNIEPKEVFKWLIKTGVAATLAVGLTVYGAYLNSERQKHESDGLDLRGGVQVLGGQPNEKLVVELPGISDTITADQIPMDILGIMGGLEMSGNTTQTTTTKPVTP